MKALVGSAFLVLLMAAGLLAGSPVGAVEPTAVSEQSAFRYDGDLGIAFDAAAPNPGDEGPVVAQIFALPAFSAVGHTYDPAHSLVAPRTALSLGRFADDTFYDVIPTRAGDLEIMAEVAVSDRTLTLSDLLSTELTVTWSTR